MKLNQDNTTRMDSQMNKEDQAIKPKLEEISIRLPQGRGLNKRQMLPRELNLESVLHHGI